MRNVLKRIFKLLSVFFSATPQGAWANLYLYSSIFIRKLSRLSFTNEKRVSYINYFLLIIILLTQRPPRVRGPRPPHRLPQRPCPGLACLPRGGHQPPACAAAPAGPQG